MTEVPATLPWWKSRVIVGAIISALCKLLFAIGITGEIAADQEKDLADAALLIAGLIGDAIAVQARVSQKHAPPITARRPPSEAA